MIVPLCAVALLTLPARPSRAQTNTAEIEGVVTDPLGGVLPGATVVVVHASTGLRLERVCDAGGRYFVPALPVGEYAVTVLLDGFKTTTRSGIVLQVGQRLDLPIVLPVGSRTEQVTVTAASPLLQTANAEVSTSSTTDRSSNCR